MTSFLKSFALSFSIHATVLCAMYLIPAARSDHFASSGQTAVVSIEMSFSPVSIPPVAITPPDRPLETLLDSAIDAMMIVKVPMVPDRTLADSHPASVKQPSNFKLAPSPSSIELPRQSERLHLKRRERSVELPMPTAHTSVPRPRVLVSQVAPSEPSQRTDPIVGLDDKVAPDFSNNQPPSYPSDAIRRHLEGTVTLRLTVSASGEVKRVEVTQSSGHAILDRAATEAVQKWKGTPAQRWGRPIETTEVLPIRFRL